MKLLELLKLPPLPQGNAAPPAAAKTAAGVAAAAGNASGAATKKSERLSKAAESWRQTHAQADERITALQAAVKAHVHDASPELLDEIEKSLVKLDNVLDGLDHRLADSLAAASAAKDDAARDEELKNAKTIFSSYIDYVKGEPLIAHMDENPFGVKTELKGLLIAGLTLAGKAIG